jgi:hypothetical protein
VSFLINGTRHFGTLVQHHASKGCPNMFCGTAHLHVRDDKGIFYTVVSRNLTYEED